MAYEDYLARGNVGGAAAAGAGVVSTQPGMVQSPVVPGVGIQQGLQVPPRAVVLAPPPVMMPQHMPQMMVPSAPYAGTPLYVIR